MGDIARLLKNLVICLAIVLLPRLPGHWVSVGGIERGRASQYAPQVMERVVRYRQSRGELPQDLSAYVGAVAVRECADIGDAVWLRFAEGGGWQGPFVAADCGCPIGKKWMEDNNVWVEVDYPTAERGGFVGRMVRVEVLR